MLDIALQGFIQPHESLFKELRLLGLHQIYLDREAREPAVPQDPNMIHILALHTIDRGADCGDRSQI